MDEKERMLNALFSGREGRKVEDVKFFLGDDRNVTDEEICREFNKAHSQVTTGAVQARDSLDGGITKNSIDDFIKA